jgi:hypothetical protein
MSKPRSDSAIYKLTDAHQAALADWLLGGMKYTDARERVASEFGITIKSLSFFSKFWEDVCVPHLLAKRRRAVATAEEIYTEAQKDPGRFDAATLDAIKQRAFDLSVTPNTDPRDVHALMSLILKCRDQDHKVEELGLLRRRLELLETKERAALEAKQLLQTTASKGGLTPETLAEIERAASLL